MRDESPIFPIADIVTHYAGDVTYRGGWSPMKCFIHSERTASASINHSAQRYMCHRCLERSEDAIGLVMFMDNVDYKRAVETCEAITTATNEPASKKPGGMSSMFD